MNRFVLENFIFESTWLVRIIDDRGHGHAENTGQTGLTFVELVLRGVLARFGLTQPRIFDELRIRCWSRYLSSVMFRPFVDFALRLRQGLVIYSF